MKFDKKLFICAMLVFMLFLCVNAGSAAEPLDDSLGADIGDEIPISDASDESLGASGGGDYAAISSADGNATGGDAISVNNERYIGDSQGEQIVLPQGTVYVSETGDDSNDGLSEENAIASLAHAVELVQARENKTATVYVLNGDYTVDAIDIGDDVAVSLSVIGQQKGEVTIHGTGAYVFDVYGDNLVWNFKNLDFDGLDSTARTSAALVLYSKYGNFTVDNCSFRNINSKLGAIALGNENGNTNVTNCIIEDVTGSVSSTSVLTVNGDSRFILDNLEIRNCRLNEAVASGTVSAYLRAIIYVNTYEADVTISNSRIRNNGGPMMSLIESRSKLTIVNTTISGNTANASLNGANGGDTLIWASNDNSDIRISQCVISNNTVVKSGKGLFYNQRGSMNVEYSDLSNNAADAFIGSTGTITADNNWWTTNDQPDAKVDKWVIMNVDVDDSHLTDNNTVALTIDFNHVKTSSGNVEELTGGEIPKESYTVDVSAQNGEIAPASVVVEKGAVKVQTFNVTEINDVIVLNCDGDVVEIPIEGFAPYRGIIYVNKTGDNENEGSIEAPVADLTKAIELASAGSGQIIIDEGTYVGCGYQITSDLNITGVGRVILDADGQGGLFATGYPTDAGKIILSNLTLAGANASYGQAINSYASELILNNVNITDNPGDGSLIIQSGKLTIRNCIIANHNGGNVITDSSSAQIIIYNTLFENNTVTDYAVCYLASYSGEVIVENSRFVNNTGKLGIIKTNKKIAVKDSQFISNTNVNSYGGAICDCDEFTITNSTFIDNRAAKDGGAINIGYNRVAKITKSSFINNTANTDGGVYYGDAIYNYGKLTINYCTLLSNGDNSIIYSKSEHDANAQYNWWGTNSNPKSLNGVGTYEDDWYDEVDCVIDSSKWVVMNVSTNLTENTIDVGDIVEITVDFTNYMDSDNTLKLLNDSIPEVVVACDTVNGAVNCSMDATKSNMVKFLYFAVVSGEDTISISSSDASVEIPVTVEGSLESEIYVDAANGLDTNDGKTRETAVKTLEKAVEIADDKIIVLAGEYTVNTLLNITKDLEIIGEGDVTVKSNSVYTITVEEWDDWDEEWVTSTETHYNLIENNANLSISNIRFTLAAASISEPMIINNANLLINTSEFANIKVTSSKGVIQNVKGATLEVNGTVFRAASSTYGAINSNGELLVNNSRFLDNDRSAETGAYSTAITAYNKATIINSEFKNNKASAGGAVYVMYSYTNKANPVVDIVNCTFEENKACGSYGDGGAVKCSGNQVTLTVSNSTFSSNSATRNGGAVYAQGNVNINGCVFTDNSAATASAVYAYGGVINVSDSIILESGNAISRYESSYSDPATVTANDNWWGSNDAPSNIGANVTVERWVKMDASFTPASAHTGDEAYVTATFDSIKLPDGVIKVTFTSTSGNLNEVVTVMNAQANVTYTISAGDVDITATSGNASVVMPIEPPAPEGTIYVSYETGDDSNDGMSEVNAVKTIAHAIELANAGIGKIILLEGTHILDETLSVTNDLDIKGLGRAVIDGNNKKFIQNGAGLNLTNIEFTNGYSADSSLIGTESTGQYMNLNNVKFYRNGGKNGVAAPAGIRLSINNSEFYDNNLFEANMNSQGVVYSNNAAITVENSIFRNNTANKGAGIYILRGSADILNCTFDANIAQNGNGAGIQLFGAGLIVNIANSTFTNNLANRSESSAGGYGSAIYIGTGASTTSISQSVFINNTGNGKNMNDAGIYVSAGSLNVTDSIILTNDGDARYAINVAGGSVSAENNWWGNNENANTNAEVSKIVKMTATLTPEDAQAGEAVNITVAFDNENLPGGVINVTFASSSGLLDEAITMTGSQAIVSYSGDERDLSISVKSSQAEIIFEFDPDAGIIFVLPGGDDANPGTRDAPVGTITHALEIADNGKIVLLEGTHKTGDLGVISDDLTITGEGLAIIDAQNSNRILYVGEDAKVEISNVVMINGYTIDESGALLGSSNELTLINCILANSSASANNGGAIFSVGKLTIINTTIANCSAVRGGAIYTQTEKESTALSIVNSTFVANIAYGKETWGGGAIYAQRTGGLYDFTLTVDNSSFIANEAQGTSCGGAIQIEQLNSDVRISGSEFISNHANGKDSVGGGAIYTSSPSSYDRQGSMTIVASLFENNTCDSNGGAICAKTTTVNVANSVLVNNTDSNGLAVYGVRSESQTPSITLNDNWWGTNDSPKGLVGGNSGYKPTLNRWAVLTLTNDTPIAAANLVRLTASINSYTTGTANGTLSKPITVKRDVTFSINRDEITIALENGAASYDFTVPEDTTYIAATVDGETQVLYVISSPVTVQIGDVNAKKYEKVSVEINVTSIVDTVNAGIVELYVNGEKLIASIDVKNGKAIGDIVVSEDQGEYNLTARYVNGLPLFEDAEANATLTVTGSYGLYNETFFNYFDEDGLLRDEITDDELVFHGEFSGLDVTVMTIPRSISIKGDGAIVYGMALSVPADSKVSDMTFVADGTDFSENDGAVIKAEGENVEINNVFVNYTAPDTVNAFAVLADSADAFKLINSTILFDSNNRGAVHHAVNVKYSNDVEIRGNTIAASLPAVDIVWNFEEPYFSSIDQNTVLAIGLQGGSGSVITENRLDVSAKSAVPGYVPTLDTILACDVTDLEISWNNITHVDMVNEGIATALNSIDLQKFSDVTVKFNNVLVNTTSGVESEGTAYPIQAIGPYSGLVIDNNNLTSVSKGPALGIYSQNYDGSTEITVTFNNINVTGNAANEAHSLVSGMELQDTVAYVYNNTIYSQSESDYDAFDMLYGISYSQFLDGPHSYDIRDNTVYSQGRYAIYLLSADDSNVTGNTLLAHEVGDASVFIGKGENNMVRNNLPASLSLTVEADDITVGQDAVISISLNGDAEGIVTVVVNNQSYVVDIVGGFGNVTVSGLGAGEYTVTAKFESAAGQDDCENSTSFNVAKLDAEMNVDVSYAVVGEDTVISVSVPGATGNVTVEVDGNEYEIDLAKTGNVTVVFAEAGEYTVVATYSGDDMHYENSTSVSVIVNKKDVSISVDYDAETYELAVLLANTEGKGLVTANVVVSIDGVDYALKTNSKGQAKFSTENLTSGKYNVTVSYKGNAKYNAASETVEIFVKKSSVLTAPDVSVVYEDESGEFVATLTNDDGKALSSANVVVAIDGVDYALKTNSKGQVKVSTDNLTIGTHTAYVSYKGNAKYNSASATATIVVNKKDAVISVEYDSDAFELVATLTNYKGKELVTANVIVSIDGVDYALKTNSKGQAKLSIANLTSGYYNVTVSYKGNNRYNAANETAEIFVKKSAVISSPDVSFEYGDESGVFVATLTNADGKALSSANVVVTLDGVDYALKTNSKGQVKVSLANMTIGTYAASVSYKGNAKYAPATATATVEVTKKATNISAVYNADTNQLVATLTNGEGKALSSANVVVTLDGVDYALKTNSKGHAKLSTADLASGNYTATVSYKGNTKYAPASATANVVIQ